MILMYFFDLTEFIPDHVLCLVLKNHSVFDPNNGNSDGGSDAEFHVQDVPKPNIEHGLCGWGRLGLSAA